MNSNVFPNVFAPYRHTILQEKEKKCIYFIPHPLFFSTFIGTVSLTAAKLSLGLWFLSHFHSQRPNDRVYVSISLLKNYRLIRVEFVLPTPEQPMFKIPQFKSGES